MKTKVIAKWAARLIGMVTSIFFLSFLIGEGSDGLFRHIDPIFYVFLPMMALALLGYGLSWFWEDIGGPMTMLGGVAMFAFHLCRGDVLTALVYGAPFILIGLLFIISVENMNNDSMLSHK